MDIQPIARIRDRSIAPFALPSIALALVLCWTVSTGATQDSIRLVHLEENRNLIARTSREGVILHFMGKRSSPDDNVVLLPNRTYIADVRWLGRAGAVVVAAGPGETPVDVYGFDRDGRRLYRQRSRQEEGERLHAQPGDSLVVVSDWGLGNPPEVLNARTGEWMAGYLWWPSDHRDSRGCPVLRHGSLFVFEGGLVVMAERREEETIISAQKSNEDGPLWELHATTGFAPTVVDLDGVTSQDTTLLRSAPEDPARWIAAGGNCGFLDAALSEQRIVLAGVADGNPVVVSLDRASGEVMAATRLPGTSVTLVVEAGGARLLAIVQDRNSRGHLLILDQATLEFRGVIANPSGWYVHQYFAPRVLSTRDGGVCLVPNGIGGPTFSAAVPRSLVVIWGETTSVYWLDAPADLPDDGKILVAREYKLEGGFQEFRIEEWSP